MNIYEITFPYNTTFYVSGPDSIEFLTRRLNKAVAFKSQMGAMYNPRQFISINPVQDTPKLTVRNINDVLVEN